MFDYGLNMPLPSIRKMQLLNILSEVLNKFVSIIFKIIIVLKAAFYNNSISYFKHRQRRSFWRNLQISRRVLLMSEIGRNISETFVLKYVIYIKRAIN